MTLFSHWFKPKPDKDAIIERQLGEMAKKDKRIAELESELASIHRIWDTETAIDTIEMGVGE